MENSISKKRPHLALEWSKRNLPQTPEITPYGSNKLAWWHGKCGHDWQSSPKARSNGEGCPICSGKRIVEGINDLQSKAPEVAAEWSEKNLPLKPSKISAGSHKKVIWHGKCGHEWIASVKSRVEQGTGCPYCSHNLVLPGFNDLATLFPDVASEWSDKNLPLTPDKVTAFKNMRVWWECSLGHEWYTLISTRSGGSKCPYCSGIKLLKGFNDFATREPQLAKEWSVKNMPLKPDMINEKSTKCVWWKCKTCGNEYKAVVRARVKGLKCPVCSERAVLKGYNDIETTDPLLMHEWDYERNALIKPDAMSRNSMAKVWWKCKAGHSWRQKISERTIEEKTCPICEAEFQQFLPLLLVKYYAKLNSMVAETNSDEIIGTSLYTYIPQISVAIEVEATSNAGKNEQNVRAYICEKNGIKYIMVKVSDENVQLANSIKEAFRKCHCHIATDTERDIELVRKWFMMLR